MPPAVVLFRPGLRHGPLRDKSSDASDPRHAGRRRRRLPPQQLRRVTQQEAEAAKCGGSCTPTAHRQGRATAAKNQAGGWVSSAHAGTGLAPAHMMPASSPCRSDMLRSAYVIILLVVGLWNNCHDDACDVGRGPQARVSLRGGDTPSGPTGGYVHKGVLAGGAGVRSPRGKKSGFFYFYAHFSRAAASRHAPRKRRFMCQRCGAS